MRRHFIYIYIILFNITAVHAQINKNGLPLIKNYSGEEYGAHNQNWAIAQDNRGYMYFGNTNCVLEFNGKSWQKFDVSNKSIVRSLAVDNKNIVYVGAVDEFGYLYPNELGLLQYKSLKQEVDSTNKIGDVWKTYAKGDSVYFCTYYNVFVFSNFKLVKKIDLVIQSNFCFFMGETLCVGNLDYGILKLNGDTSVKTVIKGGEFYKKMTISAIIPHSKEKYIIATFGNGSFLYDKKTGKSKQFFKEQSQSIVNKGILYNATKLANGYYAFAIVYNGVLITDNKGNVVYHYSDKNGLNGDMPFYVYQNNSGPLWIGKNSGISRINVNIPINYFTISEDLGSPINDIIKFKGILYIGTDDGVYYISNKGRTPELKKTNINMLVWKFLKFKYEDEEFLLAGTQQGIYDIRDTTTNSRIENNIIDKDFKQIDFLAYNLYKTKDKPYLLIFSQKNIFSLKYIGNSKWEDYKPYELNITVKEVVSDRKENLWLGTELSGVFKAKFIDSLEIIKKYDKHLGLKNLRNIKPIYFNETIYFSSEDGIYKLENDKLIKQGFAGLNKNVWIHAVSYLRNNKLSFFINTSETERKLLVFNPKTNILDSISFGNLPDAKKDAYIIEPEHNMFIIAYGKKIFYLDYYNAEIDTKLPKPIFSRVLLKNDVPLFEGVYVQIENKNDSIKSINILSHQTNDISPVLEYSQNDLKFVFFSPYYNKEEKILFSYKLEGNDDEWSNWSTQNFAYKNNLKEGDYIFKVKSKNLYGEVSDIAEFKITIKAPWYRTIWMYILYIIVGIALIVLIVYLNSRRLIKEKLRLEQIVKERTAEVVAQKTEIEAQRDEIVAQRDLVLEQKEHIEHIHEEITDSIHYAKRIQRAILPDEDHVNKAVPEHFILFKPKDIVSGDYYWASILENDNKVNKNLIGKLVITAADCTGHGVPGAFMSMLGVSFLNEIVNEKGIDRPDLILNMMRENVISSLQQKGAEGEQKDGMDMALCVIDMEKMKLQFAGANNPVYIIRNKNLPEIIVNNKDAETKVIEGEKYTLKEIKADKMPIAIYVLMSDFKLNEVDLLPGDTIYMFSDGYADQFGGKKGKKFKYKPFKNLLLNMQDLPMHEQKDILNNTIEDWMNVVIESEGHTSEQIDDIVVIGVKIP